MFRHIIAVAAAVIATPAFADIEEISARGSVAEVTDRLEAAVEQSGATIFARIDQAGGAQDGGPTSPAQLLIFGKPETREAAMREDVRAWLALPLRVLVFQDDDGETRIAYEEVEEIFDDLDIDDDDDLIEALEEELRDLIRGVAE